MSADKDARIAELERKLAEQQAVWERLWCLVNQCGDIVHDFSKRKPLFDSIGASKVWELSCTLSNEIRQLSNRTDCVEELNNLLAKEREAGRKEAVPEEYLLLPRYFASDVNTEDLKTCGFFSLADALIAAAPKPQGETP